MAYGTDSGKSISEGTSASTDSLSKSSGQSRENDSFEVDSTEDSLNIRCEMNNMNLLDEAEVRRRLESYTDETVTDELYNLGQLLLRDLIDRIAKSDSSAFGLAAYCGGVIAVIVSSSSAWRASFDLWAIYLLAITLLIVAVAGAIAIYSSTPQDAEWFSSNEWLPRECLTGRDRLKRYYVLALWGVVKNHQAVYKTRLRALSLARWMLVVAGSLWFTAFLDIAWRHAPL